MFSGTTGEMSCVRVFSSMASNGIVISAGHFYMYGHESAPLGLDFGTNLISVFISQSSELPARGPVVGWYDIYICYT